MQPNSFIGCKWGNSCETKNCQFSHNDIYCNKYIFNRNDPKIDNKIDYMESHYVANTDFAYFWLRQNNYISNDLCKIVFEYLRSKCEWPNKNIGFVKGYGSSSNITRHGNHIFAQKTDNKKCDDCHGERFKRLDEPWQTKRELWENGIIDSTCQNGANCVSIYPDVMK